MVICGSVLQEGAGPADRPAQPPGFGQRLRLVRSLQCGSERRKFSSGCFENRGSALKNSGSKCRAGLFDRLRTAPEFVRGPHFYATADASASEIMARLVEAASGW